jgi:hypothetical protein
MAWIVWRGRGDRKFATVRWKDPRTGVEQARALGTDDPHAARLEKARVEAEIERRKPRVAQLTGDDLLDAWLADRKARGHIGESTEEHYRGKVGPFLRAHPDLPLARLTVRHVEVWVAAHRAWKPRTVQAFLVCLGTLIAWGKREGQHVPLGLLEEVRAIERPPVRLIDRNVLTPAQVGALLTAARGAGLECAVALAAGAGLGLGDLRTLRWDEVDLAAGTLHRPAGRRKTGERYRVPLAPFVVEVLKRAPHDGETVCALPPMRTLRERFDALHKAAGVPRASGDGWHRLRHTFASMLAGAGVPLPTIRVLLGHAPGSLATLRYLHPEESRALDAVRGVDAAMRGETGAGDE